MFNLIRGKVSSKIALGYIIIFICIVVVCSFFVYRLYAQYTSLKNITEKSSIDAQFSSDIIELMLETSYQANLYIVGRDELSLRNYFRSYDQLLALISNAENNSYFAYSKYNFEEIHKFIEEFNDSFSQAIILVGNIKDFKNQILDVQNINLDTGMTELRVNSVIQSDFDSYVGFSEVQKSILTIQLYIINYLQTGDEKYKTLADEEYIYATEAIKNLENFLQGDKSVEIVNKLSLSLDTYFVGFQIIQEDILSLKNLRITSLEVLAPKVIEQARGVNQRVQVDTQSQVILLQEQLRNTFALFGIFIFVFISVSVVIIKYTSEQITKPLSRIKKTAFEIANHDLRSLTRDLESLSRGNLAVGAEFVSRPIEQFQDDEVGEVAQSLNEIVYQLKTTEKIFYDMADYLNAMSNIAANISQNNFNVNVEVRSEHDALGNALAKMVRDLQFANIQVQKQFLQLTFLRQIDSSISSNVELYPTIHFILDETISLLDFSAGCLILFEENSEKIKDVYFSCSELEEQQDWVIGKAQYIRREERPFFVNNISMGFDQQISGEFEERGYFAWYGALINVKKQFKGVFQLFHNFALNEDEKRIEFFNTLTGQVAIAVEHAELLHDLEEKVASRTLELNRRALQTQTAAEISHSATSTLQLDDLMGQSVELIRERFNMYYVGLFLVDANHEQAWLRAATGSVGKKMLREQYRLPLMETSMIGWTINRGNSRLALNTLQDPMHYHNPLLPETRSELTIPLITRGQVIGGLSVQSNQTSAFTTLDVTILQTIADQLANAIANARLYQESQRERRFFEGIVRTSPVAVVIMDYQESILVWNPAAEKLFGWSAAEALGKRLVDLVVPDNQKTEAASIRNLMDEGKSIRNITRRSRKDGTLIDVELSAIMINVDGSQSGILVLYHDITELLFSKKKADQATQAKSEFLANVSHEIRTPMNAILGMSNLLLESSLSYTQRDYVETIESSSEALLSLLNDILDFSKIEARRLELEFNPFELRDCVESALDLVAVGASEKGLDIAYFIAPNAPMRILGDITRLRQVLINLLNNAVKFTELGEVGVEIEAKLIPDTGGYEYQFSVRDTGIGVNPNHTEKLFQSFSQAELSTTRRFGGTGLGLAISKQLVELMGGKIWFESSGKPGEGSVFYFTIQAQVATDFLGRPTEPDPQILRGTRALVGLPVSISADFLIRYLLLWGVQVDHRVTAEEIDLAFTSNEKYAFVILDHDFVHVLNFEANPDLLDYEVIKAYAKTDDYAKFIFVTNRGYSAFYEDEGLIGLEKPIKPMVLLNILKNVNFATHENLVPSPNFLRLADEWPLNVLVVEDNLVNQKVTLLLLQQLGYQAELVYDGYEAIEILGRKNFHIIFMDIQLPEMDGIETARRINQLEGIEKPFLVAMTADLYAVNHNELLSTDLDAYITKPVKLADIRNVIYKVVDTYKKTNSVVQELIEKNIHSEGVDDVIDSSLLYDYFPQMKKNDLQNLKELINLFLNETPKNIDNLRESQKIGDFEQARKVAHTIKGTSLTFGAVKLSNMAIKIEEEIKNNNFDKLNELINQIEKAFIETIKALKAIGGIE